MFLFLFELSSMIIPTVDLEDPIEYESFMLQQEKNLVLDQNYGKDDGALRKVYQRDNKHFLRAMLNRLNISFYFSSTFNFQIDGQYTKVEDRSLGNILKCFTRNKLK